MENMPERSGDPQARLRASDVDRDRVVEVLQDALMTGRLTQDEHAERLEQTLNARTLGELEPITQDLVLPGQQLPTAAPAPAAGQVPIERPLDGHDGTDLLVGIFGAGERRGRWRVKRHTNAIAMFGGCDIDMSGAIFESREVTVTAFAIFGGVDITVPPGVEVRSQGVGIFGGFGGRAGEDHDPNAPVVVLKGLALFGGVGFKTAKPKKARDRDGDGGSGHHHLGH